MPFRLLKSKSKQYNVVSKNTFVISVELLDNGIMECTLDAESTGRDCLHNVSQRLGLHQPEFFGLRYISRGVPPRQRWVELDRPLRKQLEKYAEDSQLSLGVMFYVTDVNLLKDEVGRYHYFLQLKSDVIEGKLNCNVEQAVSLAAYSLQAEFGDFDPERHTVEYLRDFAILPKELIVEQRFPQINLDGLFEAVVRQYASLVGFPPPLAEIYYIMVAQQLDGYGQEFYPAKDDAGNEILICVCINGLLIRRRDWTHIAAFRWPDIKSMLGHKRLLVVESAQSHRTMQYHFADAEVAKYIRKICLLQSNFFKENIAVENTSSMQSPQPVLMSNSTMNSRNGNFVYGGRNTLQHPLGMMLENPEHADNVGAGAGPYYPGVTPDLLAPAYSQWQSTAGIPYQAGANSAYQSSANSSTFNNSGMSLNSSTLSGLGNLNYNSSLFPPSTNQSGLQQQQSHPLQRHSLDPHHFHHPGELYHQVQMMPTMRTNPLAGMQPLTTNMGDDVNDPEYSNGYGRAVSDYTAALQQKYGNLIPDLSVPKSTAQLYFSSLSASVEDNRNLSAQEETVAAQEEEPIYQNEIVSQIHSMELKDSDSQTSTTNSTSDLNGINQEENSMNLMFKNALVASDSSDLHSSMLETVFEEEANPGADISPLSSVSFNDRFLGGAPIYTFKPPPPYPGLGNRLALDPFQTSGSADQLGNKIETNIANVSRCVEPETETTYAMSQLSPSATSSVVSAEIHSEPRNESQAENKSTMDANSVEELSTSIDSLTLQLQPPIEQNKLKEDALTNEIAEIKPLEKPTVSSTISKSNINNESTTDSSTSKTGSRSSLNTERIVDKPGRGESSEERPRNKNELPIDLAVLKEFKNIPRTKPNPSFVNALRREHSSRNRNTNVIPYDDSAVRLSSSKQNPNGYINASPVSRKVGDREWLYIIGQLPVAGQMASIWQMIWESEVKIIVTLERDLKAPLYPLQKGSHMTFGDLQVQENKVDRRNSASTLTIAKEFILTYIPKKKQRKIWILPYEEEWKDDVPVHTEHFLCFLEEVNSAQRKVSEPLAPLAVICGTGAGRSGVFILSDLLLHAADCGHKIQCDILLRELRMQRMALVNTASQYAFVLQTLAKYLAQSRLI